MDESSQSKLTRRLSERKKENPDNKMDFPDRGIDFLRESELGKPSKSRNSGSQELTLSYLCENSKQAFLEKDFSGKAVLLNPSFEKGNKGKEVLEGDGDDGGDGEKWVERDFLNLNNSSLKREIEEEKAEDMERESKDKRQKLETLNLSLALPDVSLSLTASNALHKPARSVQSLTYNSNDYTAASLSYSYSHPFSHNPSCSLTRNSTENYEYSVGKDDQIWNCGEGTNGSVHSRFKPIGDGHVGVLGLYSLMQGNKKDSDNINNHSFFPSELPARPVRIVENNGTNNNGNNNNNNSINVTQSGDSRGKAGSESLRGLDRPRKVSRPERILKEIVSDSVPVMAQKIQELSEETILFTKEYLRNLISQEKDELVSLQTRLERRSDLTKETLLKCQKDQLEILVAVKLGLASFLSAKNRLPSAELVDIFLFARCRNVNCKSLLPVDDCDCKICSGNKGFCSSCMCPVCLNFDCANNTCSWVGCDVCSHWCHASCGIQRNLIKPGPSLKGPSGTSEMQFHCIGCGHASEMFGFVKDVFLCCAKDWGLETLIKELDCVRKIFRGSDDFKGKELYNKAEEIISKLGSKLMSPKDACSFITQFFNYTDGMAEFPSSGLCSKELVTNQATLRKDATPVLEPVSLPAKYAAYNMSSSLQLDMPPNDLRHSDFKASLLGYEDDFRFGSLLKPDGFDSLESIVRIKEAEARMFQTKADEALREAEEYHRVIRATMEKMEGEYAEKLAKLRLQETEERRRKKLEELKVLENSHCDYYKMKLRMQDEITGLLERMEATKQQWV